MRRSLQTGRWFVSGALAIFLLSLVSLIGCSGDSISTAPPDGALLSGEETAETATADLLRSDTSMAEKPGSVTRSVTEPVTESVTTTEPATDSEVKAKSATILASQGGAVTNGRVSLSFPPGALPADTEITVLVSRDDLTGKKVEFELLPHGIQFAVPVTLTVQMGGMGLTAGDDVAQYWWDESTGTWVDIGGVWDGHTVTTPLEHFSRYKTGRVGW